MNTQNAIKRLRSLEPDLRSFGVEQLSLFGSRARNKGSSQSDIDLAIRFGPDRKIGGFAFADLEHRLEKLLDCKVDLVIEPARKTRLQEQIDRDRTRVF